ncbi:Uma2 family endonuclease [Kitasatospora sp. NA04385]|uniref:Uma2 family endonuclease n=1 Tax=Kitasatospora sp. NA04385 TaxID=2742135 RepID=UPI0015922581|nr:Uma2 family endonuclease [Kitasatospora sp. NA04385]QKW19638.1 Uma2 family endonuclease [Kitasatospora sp. NA04385]
MSVAVSDHLGPWTVDDVLALPEDTRHRIELLGGALLMSPNPGVPHQRASLRLAVLLGTAIVATGAPFEVLEAVNVLVPDGLLIPDLVIADAAAAAEAGSTLHADDVVVAVEIASPSTEVIDRRTKPGLYAAAGIPHYWRLELAPAPRLHLGRLTADGGGYLDRTVGPGESTALTDPFPFDLDPAALRR